MANYDTNLLLELQATILNGIYQTLSNTHTNLIGKIVKVNSTTIDVKPVINRVVEGKEVELSIFEEVPIINFIGGNSYIQMPLQVGDYCMLFVNERSFDNWYYGKDFTKPIIPRMHDYSDCVALVGLHNKAGELTIPDTIKMNGDCLQIGNYEHQGDREQTGDYTINDGILTIPSSSDLIIDDGDGNMISLRAFIKTHTHGGVQSGGSNTSIPNI